VKGEGGRPAGRQSPSMKRAADDNAEYETAPKKKRQQLPKPLVALFMPGHGCGELDEHMRAKAFYQDVWQRIADPWSQAALRCVNRALAETTVHCVLSDQAWRHVGATARVMRAGLPLGLADDIPFSDSMAQYYDWKPLETEPDDEAYVAELALAYACHRQVAAAHIEALPYPLRIHVRALRFFHWRLGSTAMILEDIGRAPANLYWYDNRMRDEIGVRDALDVVVAERSNNVPLANVGFAILVVMATKAIRPKPRPLAKLVPYALDSCTHLEGFEGQSYIFCDLLNEILRAGFGSDLLVHYPWLWKAAALTTRNLLLISGNTALYDQFIACAPERAGEVMIRAHADGEFRQHLYGTSEFYPATWLSAAFNEPGVVLETVVGHPKYRRWEPTTPHEVGIVALAIRRPECLPYIYLACPSDRWHFIYALTAVERGRRGPVAMAYWKSLSDDDRQAVGRLVTIDHCVIGFIDLFLEDGGSDTMSAASGLAPWVELVREDVDKLKQIWRFVARRWTRKDATRYWPGYTDVCDWLWSLTAADERRTLMDNAITWLQIDAKSSAEVEWAWFVRYLLRAKRCGSRGPRFVAQIEDELTRLVTIAKRKDKDR